MQRKGFSIAAAAFLSAVACNGAFANGDVSRGKVIFAECAPCHGIDKGKARKDAPNLFGIVGRRFGAEPGFDYPPSHRAAAKRGAVWTEENLFHYLKNPHRFMQKVGSGNTGKSVTVHMMLQLPNARDRKDIIAYLKTRR